MKKIAFLLIILLPLFVMLSIGESYSQLYDVLKLLPTDDAYVTIDYNDPDDLNQFQSINTGDLYFLKSWNIYNVTGYTNNLETIIFLKFDLTNIDPHNIQDSRLMLYPFLIDLENPEDIELFVSDNQWNESTLTYLNSPKFDSLTITSSEISTDQRWYSWDVTQIIQEYAGSQASLALKLKEKSSNQEKIISFFSKENSDKSTIPYLEINHYVDSSETTNTQMENYFIIALSISIIALSVSLISIKIRKS